MRPLYFAVVLTGVLVLASFATAFAGESLELARDGTSSYTIVHAEHASASVKLAARELQRVLKIATGAELLVASSRPKGLVMRVGAVDEAPDPPGYGE